MERRATGAIVGVVATRLRINFTDGSVARSDVNLSGDRAGQILNISHQMRLVHFIKKFVFRNVKERV